jgi:large subunit ribosomal protein L4e
MKLSVYDNVKAEKGKIDLPAQFEEKIRPDLIKKSVMAINANSKQPYGAKFRAGMRASGKLSRRRKDYKASYGIGISRVPRKIMSRNGTRMNWMGAVAPGTVKGRKAHPPKAKKILQRKVNKKERRMAIRSAMSAAMKKELVMQRGHFVPENYPFIIDSSFEDISKTKDLISALEKLGFAKELERIADRKIRPGRGKMRGRRYETKRGPLFVVSQKCSLMKAGQNITGVEVILVTKLNVRALAPSATIGRLTLFTRSSVEKIRKEGLFTGKKQNIAVKSKKSAEKED